jgi:hypothetical protein
VFLLWVLEQAGDWLVLTLGQRTLWLTVAVGGGAAIYFAAAWVAGVRVRQFRVR